MKRFLPWLTLLLVLALATLPGCGVAGLAASQKPTQAASSAAQSAAAPSAATASELKASQSPVAVAGLESTLQEIYQRVNPSVVSIEVVQKTTSSQQSFPGFQQQPQDEYQTGEGSGFVWDKQGHIVTNYHVVEGADSIRVTFADGYAVTGKVVGSDPDSDLAVVQVDAPADELVPVVLADSTAVKVGSLAVAIGQPFGLQNTLTWGVVSGVGRSMPASESSTGPSYTIPDVIQTDAPINPGNSGGVLLDSSGKVIGVPSAIISPVRASAGIGFAIPSAIVAKEVPVLIEKGKYPHPYIGVTGITLDPDMAQAMNLDSHQRGALVTAVTTGGPADKAGLKGGSKTVTINGDDAVVGGDVIVAIDGQTIKTFDDVVSYLLRATNPGQKVTLTVLREGKEQKMDVTLGERPSATQELQSTTNESSSQDQGAWLGVTGATLTSELNTAAGLSRNQRGVLVEEVASGSPAEAAGLKGGTKEATVGGQKVMVGGDIIIGWENRALSSWDTLRALVARTAPGTTVTLNVLRDNQRITVQVTLEARPSA